VKIPLRTAIAAWTFLAAPSCGIKTEVKVPVSPKIAAAKTATLEELTALLQESGTRIRSLASTSLKVTLTLQGGAEQAGILQKYHSAPGYILLRRPGDILVNIQNPLTKTTILSMASRGDPFEIWNPGKNRLYLGRNSAAAFELVEDGKPVSFSARPAHILEAVLGAPLPLGSPGIRVSRTERQDAEAKYYVLTILQDTAGPELRTLLQLWIERSQLAVVREETYSETGQLTGVVERSEMTEFAGVLLPCDIRIDRPADGYALELRFRDWRVNPDLSDADFAINAPPGAERVTLKEKGGTRH
jgi:hypothetical protein